MAREWRVHPGRHVYGLGALIFSVAALVWHHFNDWQQFRALGNVPRLEFLIYIAFAIETLGRYRDSMDEDGASWRFGPGRRLPCLCVVVRAVHHFQAVDLQLLG
jgi:hypothetical protein